MHTAHGFTLIELLLTVTVAAILLGIGVPAYTTLSQNSRLTAQTNALISSIQLARSEAARRNSRVIICSSSNPAAAIPACNGAAGVWDGGWVTFADEDGNTSYDNGTDVLLKRESDVRTGLTVRTTAAASTNIRFKPDGGIDTSGLDAELRICDERGAAVAREVLVKPVGRPESSVGTSVCP